jgi:hypothetical protein
MYAPVILAGDAPGKPARYGRVVPSAHETRGPPRLPLLFALSDGQWIALLDLLLVLVALPAAAAAGGWLFAGRELPAVARRTLE